MRIAYPHVVYARDHAENATGFGIHDLLGQLILHSESH
jgi:hypothetical protein